MRTLVLSLTVALLLLAATSGTSRAQPGGPYTADDTRAALVGAPYMVQCIVYYEVGRGGNGYAPYDPYAVGALGEEGVAQLLPAWRGGGQWNAFYYGDWTPLDPSLRSTFNPYQEIAFLEQYGAVYGYGAWSTARYC